MYSVLSEEWFYSLKMTRRYQARLGFRSFMQVNLECGHSRARRNIRLQVSQGQNMNDPGRMFHTSSLIDLSADYPKASGTVLMGLKKKRLGWKRTNCLMFRVSQEILLGFSLTPASVRCMLLSYQCFRNCLSPNQKNFSKFLIVSQESIMSFPIK